ncbi:MAG: TonB-dependent receptor [Gemmatimonadales bacterium]
MDSAVSPRARAGSRLGVVLSTALILAAMAGEASAAQAQGSISGRITEVDGAPIAGAQVVLDDGQWGTLSNDVGLFLIRGVTAGAHTVAIERIGFTTYTGQVSVTAGTTANLDVVLEMAAVELAGLTVIGSREEIERTRRQIREVPGAVALITPAVIRQTRQANFSDVLRFTPGVFAQPRFGAADETQFSIRGSGLRNNFHLRGVNILVNGMPYRLADGFTDFETLEILNTESVQVYKGANALRYGGSTLGGAINFDSKTGYTAAPLEVYAQTGSFGFFKGQIASGRVLGDFNYYASYARTDVGGFRQYSGQSRDRVNVHLGQRLGENFDVRAFYWFAKVEEDLPGSLTQTALQDDRRAADPNNLSNRYGRDYQLHHVGLQLRSQLGERTQLDIAPYFQHRDIVHPIFRVLDQVSDDWGVEARLEDERDIGGRESRFSIGAQWATGKNWNRQYANVGGESGALAKDQDDLATTFAVYGEEVLGVTDRLKAVLGARWARDGRKLDDRFLSDGDQTDERDYEAFQPKLGLLYELPAVSGQVFANASHMYEPPLMIEVNSLAGPGFVDVAAQRAWQFELGTRGRSGGLQWELSVYDLEIDDEIININVQPFPGAGFTVPTYRNASETRHLGVEAALAYELPSSVFLARDRLGARLSYTWGRFEYVTDAAYEGNRLPGTPEHYAQAEIEYNHPSGLSLKPSVEWVPASYFVDSANQVSKDGWTTLGARVDWALPRFDGSLFVEGRNLTNAHYSPAVVVDDGAGRFFFPADGRSFYAGFRWQPGS